MSNRVLATGAAVAGAAALATGIALTTHAPGPTVTANAPAISQDADPDAFPGEKPGAERWDVKTLQDQAQGGLPINPTVLNATPEQIEDLSLLAKPKERQAAETKTYQVAASLVYAHREADGDLHLALQGTQGGKFIAEIPDPQYVAQSWQAQVRVARSAADAKLQAGATAKRFSPPISVVVTGISFDDKLHGQIGCGKSGWEIHPVLKIEFP